MKWLKKRREKIVMVPYPAQGHVTPMLQLASALVGLGFATVVVVPEFIHRKIAPKASCIPGDPEEDEEEEIRWVSIPDGVEDDTPRDFFAIEKAMETQMPIHLDRLLGDLLIHDRQEKSGGGGGGGGGIACMVVDLLASSAIRVGNQHGISVAGFWPAMLATYRLIAAIPDMLRARVISHTGNPCVEGPISIKFQQSGQLPLLSTDDLPWLIGSSAARTSRFKFWSRTVERSSTLQWLLVNSFPQENQSMDRSQLDYGPCSNIFPVGPLGKNTSRTKKPSFWEEDTSCLEWLDKQRPSSVLYVSFGSWVSPIGEGKIASLALALEAAGRPFLWVLGSSWRQGLPQGYLDRVSEVGKVVSWAPQMEVLQHEAVGCFLTHCGWNSTMEAIQCKKPLLCYPVAGDQFVNCAYIVEEWKIGLRVAGFGLKDLERGLKQVTEDCNIKLRLITLNERAMGNEASSAVTANLTSFLHHLETWRNCN